MDLTELESAVLGVVWRKGPCTAYVVQANFALVSASWSASPGAVYPLMQKLNEQGLLSRRDTPWGKRVRSEYAVSARGRRALQAWVSEAPDWIGRPPADPIRTRAFFLDVLPNDEARLSFLETARSSTERALTRLQEGLDSLEPGTQEYEQLAQMGGVLSLRARLEWIKLMVQHFGGKRRKP